MKMKLSYIIIFLLFASMGHAVVEKNKILVLIISCDTFEVYEELHSVWRSYMKYSPDEVEAYFIRGNPKMNKKANQIGDVLYVRTEESFRPGILEKTLRAFEYFSSRLDSFDYVVRTNLSSFYNFPKLFEFLETLPNRKCYCGVPIKIKKKRFASGAGVIFSPDLVKEMVTKKNKIIKKYGKLADDVAIGHYFYDQRIPLLPAEWMIINSKNKWDEVKHQIPDATYHFRVKNDVHDMRLFTDPPILRELVERYYFDIGQSFF